jgi:hypothetical protein
MRKFAIALGVTGCGVRGRRCLAGRRDDLAIGDVEPPQRSKELFADREDRLWRLGQTLHAWIPLGLRAPRLLVRALLG